MRLESGVAVAVVQAGSYSFYLTPSLGTPICCGCGPKKAKKKKVVRKIFFFCQKDFYRTSAPTYQPIKISLPEFPSWLSG